MGRPLGATDAVGHHRHQHTLRIYSPAKQARDHDPQGQYIPQWVPEFGTAAYPRPIVDERQAVAAAKDPLNALRRTCEAHAEAKAIQHKHVSRKSGMPPTAPEAQHPCRAGGPRPVVLNVHQPSITRRP